MSTTDQDTSPTLATIPTTLGELRPGDRVPGWFDLVTVTETYVNCFGRCTVIFRGPEEGGMENGPASIPWRRAPRPGEVTGG